MFSRDLRTISESHILQGNAATYFRRGGHFDIGYLTNLPAIKTVKEV